MTYKHPDDLRDDHIYVAFFIAVLLYIFCAFVSKFPSKSREDFKDIQEDLEEVLKL